MKWNWRFIVLAFAIAFVIITASAADQKTQDLYKSRCQSCHGADGKATTGGKKLGAKDFQDPDVANASQADLVKITS
jgi:mono/diheme cytochrome c family protein